MAKIEAAPSLLASINRHAFVQNGLGLVDGPNCPLCDTAWNMEQLRAHLRDKLERSREAQAIREQILKTPAKSLQQLFASGHLLQPLRKLPKLPNTWRPRLLVVAQERLRNLRLARCDAEEKKLKLPWRRQLTKPIARFRKLRSSLCTKRLKVNLGGLPGH
ncbi:hypothetical protein [Granulicella sp. L60]|uniref:hypothetical protein n=1 Tax=Granulicella sp. L60 TaxID=1641866 RepID=UPI00131CA16A|nr:hypothetical protein [Granulicella sp. L60]